MGSRKGLVRGLLIGAGTMYFLDRERGRRRRVHVRDRVVHLLHRMDGGAGTVARDLGNRVRGMVAEGRGRIRGGKADDRVLEARVRSELGWLGSHPGSIDVVAQNGHVTLSGPVLAAEVDRLLAGVGAVRGVKAVESRLEVHPEAGSVPGLQGRGRRRGPRPEILQENWAPATRLLVGALGGAMAVRGVARRRRPLDAAAGVAGAGMLARALTNMDFRRLVGIGEVRRGVDVQKTVNVDAPLEDVFALWSNFENFPRFMSHLSEVRNTGPDRSHWVARLPGGLNLGWDAEITTFVPNEVIAWRSLEGSPVRNAGIVRFQPGDRGRTRVDVRMTYLPPVGALGHAAAWLLGSDARRLMDEDLVRFQSLLEHGKATTRGGTALREEILGSAGEGGAGTEFREPTA